MNCDVASERLIELVYDELSEDARRALQSHLAECSACRRELARLRFARSVLAESFAGEPEAGRFDPTAAGASAGKDGARPPARRRAARLIRGPRRWLGAVAAVAAAAAILLAIWVLQEMAVRPAAARMRPVEIERVNVSLTVLSKPEGWRERGGTAQRLVPVQFEVQTAEVQPAFYRGYDPPWPGMALVRDHRLVRHLKRGHNRVRFREVPSAILPDSVRLRSLHRPGGLKILEQNYQYDLASAAAVLKRHVGEPVTAVFKDGRTVSGTLLSFDDRTLVVRPDGEGPRNVTREKLRGIALAKLPEGLLTRPTLVWDLENLADARQQFEVAYLTHGLTWRADYVLKLRPAQPGAVRALRKAAGAKQGKAREEAPIPDIVDTADLVGYATVENTSGVTFRDAQLKLLAGDVNIIRQRLVAPTLFGRTEAIRARGGAPPVMTEKAFFEYHLYTVTRPTTIRDRETKQLEMVSGAGVKLARGYVYNRRAHATAVRVVSELMNSEANGLGKPLPKGVVRLYAPDPTGAQTFVANTTIDHTPKDEKLRLPWGHAFDIVCSAKRTEYERRGSDRSEKWRYQLRNHKPHGVNVTVIAHVPRSTYRAECSHKWHVREVGLVEIDVPVPADSAAEVTFAYRWDSRSGGGLRSPHDKRVAAQRGGAHTDRPSPKGNRS